MVYNIYIYIYYVKKAPLLFAAAVDRLITGS